MSLTVTHAFVSPKPDGLDASKIRASNWGSAATVGPTHVVTGVLPAGNVDLSGVVAVTRQVNGHALSADVVVSKADVGLPLVENTALSTWGGSANLTTIGPLAGLMVGGAVSPNGVEGYFATSSASDPRGLMSAQYSTDAIGARLHLRKGRGTEAAPAVVVSGDVLGRIRFSGYDGANYLQMGSIDVVSTGTIASTRVPSYMTFSVATDAAPSVLTEVLRLTAPTATSALIAKMSVGATGNAILLQAALSDNGAVGYENICVGSIVNPGDGTRNDHILTMGYNTSPAGGRLNLTEPCFEWRIEDYYAPTSSPKFLEAHWQYYDATGAGYRPISLQVDRGNGNYLTNATLQLAASALSYNGMNGTQYVKFSAGLLELLNATQLNCNVINAAGNIILTAAQSVGFTNAGYLTGNGVTGQFTLRNNTVSTGVGFDVATDAVLKLRTKSFGGDASLTALNLTASGTILGAGVTGELDSIATTSTDGLLLQNATLATAGVPVQQSPRLRLRSNVWNTTATAASNTDDWWIESVPISLAAPRGFLRFASSLNGAAATFPLSITVNPAGFNTVAVAGVSSTLTVANLTIAGNVVNTGFFQLVPINNGQVNLTNAAASTGVGVDVATDALLKIRTRAQTGDASISALLHQTMTATIAAGGGAAPTFTTIGGTGPATAAMNGWLKMLDSTGASVFVPVWK